jgi:hypothetical protein
LSTKAQQPVDLLSFAKVMVSLGEVLRRNKGRRLPQALDLREMIEHFFTSFGGRKGGKLLWNDTLFSLLDR